MCIDRGERTWSNSISQKSSDDSKSLYVAGYEVGVEVKIIECDKDSQTQRWRYSDITNHISWYGTAHSWDRPGICLDLTDVELNQVQVSNCSTGVDSQIWMVLEGSQ